MQGTLLGQQSRERCWVGACPPTWPAVCAGHIVLCRELAAQKGVDPALAQLTSKGDKTLAECFKLFDVIHRCLCCLCAIPQSPQG